MTSRRPPLLLWSLQRLTRQARRCRSQPFRTSASTSSRSRFTYFAATPFGYRSKSAWICSIVHLRFLSSADHAMEEPGARLVRLRADPKADAAVTDVLQELGRADSPRPAPLRRCGARSRSVRPARAPGPRTPP